MTPSGRRSAGRAHDRLLAAAAALFYSHGIGQTGIDAIVSRAGVAKKSLYNNFSSKADLVNQYLEARHAEWLALYHARLQRASLPKERVLAIFDAYRDHAELSRERGFRGCGLLNAAAELPTEDVGRQAVKRHKELVEKLIAEHLRTLLPHAPERATELARHLAFLLEGAMARAGLEGDEALVVAARTIAADIVDAL